MINFFHLSRNTCRECLREPIFFILMIAALFLIGLFPSVSLFVFREQAKLVTDSAMATTLLFGLIAAVLSASHTVTREIRNGTVLLLLSKPVPRWIFVSAKIIGIISALTVFVFACSIATLVSLRVAKDQFRLDFLTLYSYYGLLALCALYGAARNFFSRKSFSASAIMAVLLVMPVFIVILQFVPVSGQLAKFPTEVLPALILLFFAVWAMGAITVTLSTRLDLVSNLTLSSILFLLGLISDYLLGRFPATSVFGRMISKTIYAVVPNWQFFWMADALASKHKIPWAYVGWTAAYIMLYMAFCGIIAIHLFNSREVGDQNLT